MNRQRILDVVPPEKDVDGLSKFSQELLQAGKHPQGRLPRFEPCAPLAVMEILRHHRIEVRDRRVTILGRGMLVGDPLSYLMREQLPRYLTVLDVHSSDEERLIACRNADIIIVRILSVD